MYKLAEEKNTDFIYFFVYVCLQLRDALKKEAEERGEEYKVTNMRRNDEMDEYDFLHWRRSLEEREALIRDISWYGHQCYIFV